MTIERTILSGLIHDEGYTRKVLPYIKGEYFHTKSEQSVFELIKEHIDKYNKLPTPAILGMEVTNRKADINEFEFKEIQEVVDTVVVKQEWEEAWLLDQTEKFCQDKAIYNGIIQSVNILKDKTGKTSKGAIPQILTDALGVTFDTKVGTDLINDADLWYELVHTTHERIPLHLNILNKITKGGLRKKTLTLLMGGVGFGKSLWLCDLAGANLLIGKKVLYITAEMSEEQTVERIYANLLNVPLDQLDKIPKDLFQKKIENLKTKVTGQLIVKEYPTSSIGAANIRHLLNELKIKKNFVPDIIYIDYLNILISNRVKFNANIGMYTYIKMIAEEVRGLAVEQNVPIVSATQVNREGFVSSDPGLENVSESFGLAATADLILAIIISDELTKLGQYMIKQLKNRYFDINVMNKFNVGVDKTKMRLYDIEDNSHQNFGPKPSTVVEQPMTISERAQSLVKRPEFSFKDFK